jgi:hypothetical protein
MRVKYLTGYKAAIFSGKVSEAARLQAWIGKAGCEVVADECDETESSFTAVFMLGYNSKVNQQWYFKKRVSEAKKLV